MLSVLVLVPPAAIVVDVNVLNPLSILASVVFKY